jgi:hypothetical protein
MIFAAKDPENCTSDTIKFGVQEDRVANVGKGNNDIMSFLFGWSGREAMSTCRCKVVVVVVVVAIVLLLLSSPLPTDATRSSPYMPNTGRSYFPVQLAEMSFRSMVMNGGLLVDNVDDADDDCDIVEEEEEDVIDPTRKFVHTISWTVIVNNPSVNCSAGNDILSCHNQQTNAL